MYRINTSNLTVTMPKATALDRDYSSQAENIARNLHIYCGPFPSPKKKTTKKNKNNIPQQVELWMYKFPWKFNI